MHDPVNTNAAAAYLTEAWHRGSGEWRAMPGGRPRYSRGSWYTEMCDGDSSVNGVPDQSAVLVSSSSPASCAMRSSSAGQI